MNDIPNEPIVRVTLRERRLVAEGTAACWFDKPPSFTYQAGQFVDLTLDAPTETDAAGPTRTLSLASAPDEPRLMIATRLRDTAFKRCLQQIPLGTELRLEGPYGKLWLPADPARPVVMLAGGIGITPFRSMLVQEALRHSSRKLWLFFGNRRPEDAPFFDELESLARSHAPFTFVPTMSDPAKSARHWQGAVGYVTAALLAQHLVGVEAPIYYIVGPPKMVTAMRTMLKDAGINQADVRTESFMGY